LGGFKVPNMRGKTPGRSESAQELPGTPGHHTAGDLLHVGAGLSPRRPFPTGDAVSVVLLLLATTLAWCSANSKWTAEEWKQPTAYLETEKNDTLSELASMKATASGQILPLVWKYVKELGAPYEADWSDWPGIEELQMAFFGLLAKVLGLFAGLNLGILIGNLLASGVFYAVCRASDCNRAWSAVAAMALGVAPYSFAQSPHHITVAYIWHIPLFLLVWKWVSTEPGIAPGTPRFWSAVGVGFVTGLQNVYYTNIFCQLTLLGAAVVYFRNHWQPARLSALAIITASASAFALMNVDTRSYQFVHGPNSAAVVRPYIWVEIYGLKLVDMVVPPDNHRSQTLARFGAAHRAASALRDEGSYLGIVGLAALALLVGRAVSGLVRRRIPAVPLEALQVLWILLFFSTGGLNAILGSLGFTLFRTACRYSVVILAIVLLHAAQRLTALQRQFEEEKRDGMTRMLFQAGAPALLVLILWDQVPRSPTAEQTATIARAVEGDRQFVAKMEEALPAQAMVFQLPVMEFPEAPVVAGVRPYDHFRPYLFSKNLRFSFGSIKGRARDKWQQQLLAMPIEKQVQEIKDRGFAAIYVNRNGYSDHGKAIEDELFRMGYTTPPLTNASGELACILLRKLAIKPSTSLRYRNSGEVFDHELGRKDGTVTRSTGSEPARSFAIHGLVFAERLSAARSTCCVRWDRPLPFRSLSRLRTGDRFPQAYSSP
jgi:phosphoglycerol transferase